MRARIRAWRRRQRSNVLFVPVLDFGTTLTPAGLRSSQRPRVRMVEVQR